MKLLAWFLNLSLFFGDVFLSVSDRTLCVLFFGSLFAAILFVVLSPDEEKSKRVYILDRRRK